MTCHANYRYSLGFILLWVSLCMSNVFATEKALEFSQTKQSAISLTEYFAVLEDSSLLLTPADVQKAEIARRFKTDFPAEESLNFGFTHSAYWLRLTLQNTGFISLMAMIIATQNGLSQEFLWPNSTWWSTVSSSIIDSCTGTIWLLFIRRMLNTHALYPKIDFFLKGLIGVFLLSIVTFTLSLQIFIPYAVPLYLGTVTVILIIGFFCAFKRQRSAYFFVAASVMLCLSVAVTACMVLGFLPSNFFTNNAMLFGSGFEMLLLALALADRFNDIRKQKELAQSEALAAHQNLVEHLQSSERILEARVENRTAELQILNSKLAALSMTDGLTGIANRRHFDQVLVSEWTRALRQGQPLAVGLLDVDWFKKYNDFYGHQAGDDCLRTVARTFAATVCRTGDLVARYGGEEFIFIAPNTGADNALLMAKRLCAALQALAMPHRLSDFGRVTVSIGVAAIVPIQGMNSEFLLKAADNALYTAKEQGRNQAILATL